VSSPSVTSVVESPHSDPKQQKKLLQVKMMKKRELLKCSNCSKWYRRDDADSQTRSPLRPHTLLGYYTYYSVDARRNRVRKEANVLS
jgi:hypothetical protein